MTASAAVLTRPGCSDGSRTHALAPACGAVITGLDRGAEVRQAAVAMPRHGCATTAPS